MTLSGDWISGGMAIVDEAREEVQVNQTLRDWLGLKDKKILNAERFWETLCSLEPAWKEAISGALAQREPFYRLELSCPGGEARQSYTLELACHQQTVFLQLNSALPSLAELEEGATEEFLQNASVRRQMFVRLLRAEGQLNNLVRRWPGVIFSQRVDLSFQFVSPKIEELTGVPVEEWARLPQRFWQVVHEGDMNDLQQQLRQAAETGQGVTSVYRIRHIKTGRVCYVLEHREAVRTQRGLLLGYEGVWLDVTRQTIAEKRLSSAAWKETLSVLTMGLAHDFSNIMAGIHSLSEAYQAQVAPDHPFQEGLALIKRNSLQASQLIHRILHLHHGKIGERNYHNLNELVAEILELVRKIVPRQIRIETAYAPESLPIFADAVEFRQVLINLALNAVDAMPQGGRLRFEISRHDSYPSLMHVQGNLPRLPSVCVATIDDGCGIPAHHLASIFDPFFTTKSLEKGSGLGLYNARLFVEKHHGAISVDSVEKSGTTVRVWLPEADFTEGERDEELAAPQRRTLLVFGPAGDAVDSTAEFLRKNAFSVLAASPPEDTTPLLRGRDYTLAGVVLLAKGSDSCYGLLAKAARRTGLAMKVIVQATGCNQDELEADLVAGADLVLPSDLNRTEMLSRINALFADRSSGG